MLQTTRTIFWIKWRQPQVDFRNSAPDYALLAGDFHKCNHLMNSMCMVINHDLCPS